MVGRFIRLEASYGINYSSSQNDSELGRKVRGMGPFIYFSA